MKKPNKRAQASAYYNQSADQRLLDLLKEFNEMLRQREKDKETMNAHDYAAKSLKNSIAMKQKVKAMTFLNEWAYQENVNGTPFVSDGAKSRLLNESFDMSMSAVPAILFSNEVFKKNRRSKKKIVAELETISRLFTVFVN